MTAVWHREPDAALELNCLCKTYDRQQVLYDISLTVAPGEVFGLLGPNGAGKTTLMKLISGLSRPDSGRLAIFGRDSGGSRQDIKHELALVAQDNNLEREFTVQEALLTYARLYGVAGPRQRVAEIVQAFNLEAMLAKRVAVLSGGMARRVMIARALLPSPRLVLLDEPTVGLDPDVRQDIWAVIKRLAAAGTTVFMTTHYMEEAEQLCQRVALLKAGRVVTAGTPAAVALMADGAGVKPTLEAAFLQLIREAGP